MAAITNQSFPGFPSMPLKSLCWSVDIDGIFPLRITYISDTDKRNNQSIWPNRRVASKNRQILRMHDIRSMTYCIRGEYHASTLDSS